MRTVDKEPVDKETSQDEQQNQITMKTIINYIQNLMPIFKKITNRSN